MFLPGIVLKLGNMQNVRNVKVKFNSDSKVEMYVTTIKTLFMTDVALGLVILLYDSEQSRMVPLSSLNSNSSGSNSFVYTIVNHSYQK